MVNPAGESNDGALRFDFDRWVTGQFRRSEVTSGRSLSASRLHRDNLARAVENVFTFYNKRGTCEQYKGRQGRNPMHAPFMPFIRCQRGSP
jgi:hypothetical protein